MASVLTPRSATAGALRVCRIATQSVTAEWSAKKFTEIIIIIIVCYYYYNNIPEKKGEKILHARAGKNDAS